LKFTKNARWKSVVFSGRDNIRPLLQW